MAESSLSVWIQFARKQYSVAKTLFDEVRVPPNDPYCLKYRAGDILQGLISELEDHWKDLPQVRLLEALFNYELGKMAIETEEIEAGIEIFTNILTKTKDIAVISECCFLSICILNCLGKFWCDQEDFKKSLDYFSQAEDLYKKFKSGNNPIPPFFKDLFTYDYASSSEENYKVFERNYTLTVYFLSRVHKSMNNYPKFADYLCHTLKRHKESGGFDSEKWVFTCAKMSQQFYMKPEIKDFSRAHDMLSSALSNLRKYEDEKKQDKQALDAIMGPKAYLACRWLEFCIILLSESVHQEAEEKTITAHNLTEIEDLLKIEEEIPSCVDSFEKASVVFRFAQKQAAIAKEYYTLDYFAFMYIDIVQCESKLYEALGYHEKDCGRKWKIHMRRLDLLDDLLKKLDPEYFPEVCRNLRVFLGEIVYEMYILKRNASKPYPVFKLNALLAKSISYFVAIIDSFRNKLGVLPEDYGEDDAQYLLVAHFYVGCVTSKLIETDEKMKSNNLNLIKKCFQYIVDHIKKHPAHEKYIENEFVIVKMILKHITGLLQNAEEL